MTEKIMEHSVSDFLDLVTGPVDETLRARVYFRDYIRWAFLIRMFQELKDNSSETSYSYLELSLASDFTSSTLALQEGFTSEEWEDYVRARFARAQDIHISDPSDLDYFSSWTANVGERLASVLSGETAPEELLEGELLLTWLDFENELLAVSTER